MTDLTDSELDELEQERAKSIRSRAYGDANAYRLSVDYLDALYAVAPRLIAAVREARAEIIEQCRLNGMGAERECALLGKVERLKRASILAVTPLEAMSLTGLDGRYPPDVVKGIREGIEAVRAVLDETPEMQKSPAGQEGATGQRR